MRRFWRDFGEGERKGERRGERRGKKGKEVSLLVGVGSVDVDVCVCICKHVFFSKLQFHLLFLLFSILLSFYLHFFRGYVVHLLILYILTGPKKKNDKTMKKKFKNKIK